MMQKQELASLLLELGIGALLFERNDFEKTIYLFQVDQIFAPSCWHQLRGLVSRTGYWPLLIQDIAFFFEHGFLRSLEPDEQGKVLNTEGLVAKGLSMNVEECLREISGEEYWEDLVSQRSLPREWPEDVIVGHELWIEASTLIMAFIPVKHGWQVPAFLRFGDTNDCPSPSVHVCLMHYWHEKYGAELALMEGDSVQMLVARPPQDKETALDLAFEYSAYCPDTLGMAGSLSDVASYYLKAGRWLFWWD